MKAAELTGAALDWAVATCEGVTEFRWENDRPMAWSAHAEELRVPFSPSTDWAQGGPIVEREIGNLWKDNKLDPAKPDVWNAAAYRKAPYGTAVYHESGPTPLIAAMRCYVASRLSEHVDIPKELVP